MPWKVVPVDSFFLQNEAKVPGGKAGTSCVAREQVRCSWVPWSNTWVEM